MEPGRLDAAVQMTSVLLLAAKTALAAVFRERETFDRHRRIQTNTLETLGGLEGARQRRQGYVFASSLTTSTPPSLLSATSARLPGARLRFQKEGGWLK